MKTTTQLSAELKRDFRMLKSEITECYNSRFKTIDPVTLDVVEETDPTKRLSKSSEFMYALEPISYEILRMFFNTTSNGQTSLLSMSMDAVRLTWDKFSEKHGYTELLQQ